MVRRLCTRHIAVVCFAVQAAQMQRQLQLAEAELAHMCDTSAKAEQQVAELQAQLQAAHQQAAGAQSALEAAARDASQVLRDSTD